MSSDITAGWFQFVADCNRDPAYPHSHHAGLTLSTLVKAWCGECPGLEIPQVQQGEDGRYILSGLSVPKKSR